MKRKIEQTNASPGGSPDGEKTSSQRRKPSIKKPAVRAEAARLRRNLKPRLRLALIVAIYLFGFIILDLISKQFEVLLGVVAWYPPAGLTYALLLVFGMSLAPAVTVALFLSSVFIYQMPEPLILLLLWAVIISLIYSLAAAFLRKLIKIDWQLRKFRDVSWFVFTTALVSALLAILSVSSSALSSAIPRNEVLRSIFLWWIGETVGVLTVAPFLLVFVMPGLKRWTEGQPARDSARRSIQWTTLSAIGQAASIVLTLYWVFGSPLPDEYHPLFLIILPLIWIALKRGFKGISLALLALNSGVVLALWLFRFDLARLGELELPMIVNCIVGLLLGAVVSERRQAEQTLQKSEEQLRLVTDNMQDLIVRTDLQGQILYASPSNQTVLGYTPEDMLGKSIYDFMHPEEIAQVKEITLASLQAQTPGTQELRYRHADGHYVWLESSGAILLDQGGLPSGAVFSSRDISERRRTETERQALLEIMHGIATTGSLKELLEVIRQSLAKAIYAENFFVVFQNKSSGLFEEAFAVDKYDPPMPPSKLEKSITSYVFRTGQPLLLSQAKFAELVAGGEAELIGTQPAIWLGAPLKTPNETIGVMVVQNYEDPDCYSERDKEFLTSVSAQVVLAIERKRTEEALHASEEKYRGLVTQISDGIFVTDDNGRLTFANPALAGMMGFESPDQLIGRNFMEFVAPAMLDELVMYFKKAVSTGKFRGRAIAEVVRANGTNMILEVNSTAIMEGSQVVGTHSVARDITQSKAAEEALRLSEEKYRSLVDEVNDGFFVTDEAGIFTFVNPALARIYGFETPEELVGRKFMDFIAPELLANISQQIRSTMHSGRAPEVINGQIVRPDGKRVFIEVKSVPIVKGGQIMGSQGVVRDVSERKQAEEEIISLAKFPSENPGPVMRLSQDGIVIYANPKSGVLLDMWGSAVGDPAPQFWVDLAHQTLANRETKTVDIVCNGKVYAMFVTPIFDAGYVNLYGRDITERKQAEETLQKSEKRFRALVEHSMEEISLVGPDGTLLWESPSTRRPLGYPPNSFEGHNLFDLFHPDERATVTRLLEQSREQPGIVQEAMFRLRHQDGSWRWMEGFLTNLLDEPAVQSFVINYRDVTERKHAEEDLQKSEDKYRNLVTEISEGIFITDNHGALTFVNPALARVHGFEHPEQMLGKTFQEFIAPAKLHEAGGYFNQIVEGVVPLKSLTTELVRPDGTHAVVEVVAGVEQSEGETVGTHGVVRDVTERKQREEAILSRTEELSALYQLSRRLADGNELAEVLELVNHQAVESVHTTFACIALMEEANLVPRAVYPVRNLEHDLTLSGRQPLAGLPICQGVMDKNEPVILLANTSEANDLERKILFLDFVQSVCLVPLRVGETNQGSSEALGLLILGEARREKREPFSPEKIRLARSIGDQAASAIRRLLLREQAERRLLQLACLSEIDRTIASVLDLHLSLQLILKHICEQLAVDAADVLVLNDSLQNLEFSDGRGFRSRGMESLRQRLGEGQAGKAALKRQVIQIPDVAASQAVFAWPEIMKTDQVAAYFAVPLITKGQVKGVLEIYQRTPLNPNEEWLDFLKTLAGQAAIAIDNIKLFDSLQRSTSELSQAYDATIEGWSHALDLRDKETEGHTRRVTGMTVELARLFGLREAELVQVRWGALLHDIGKMGVPDAILLKPGPLTEEEWIVMKKHPTLAYEMLAPIHYLRLALDIPYCHHEKWDGSGYPRGLEGEQIPLVARIFAVVDVWDALTSDRPYRQAWSEEKTREHIQAGAGTQFDAEVVKKFFLQHG